MKLFLILILFAIPYLSFSNSIFYLDNDSVQVSLSMPKHRIEKDADLFIYISITSTQKQVLQIPKGDNMAYIDKGSGFYKDSIINYFQGDSRYGFGVGLYRMKCLYWNNVHINKNTESNWVYFQVVKPIYVKHY